MKKILLVVLPVLIICFLIISCNQGITPVASGKNRISKYDSATFDYVFAEAIKQKFLGNAGDALKYLEQCIEINPQSDAAYYEMAQIALMLSDLPNGKRFVLKATSINEDNIWYLVLAANVYYQEKNLDSAIVFYEKAVRLFPEKENVKLSLASVYSENKQFAKAAEIFKYFESKYGISETNSLSIIKNLMNSGDYNNAELKAKELVLKFPEEILYSGLLAEIYRLKGDKEKAIAVYSQLMEKDPGNPQTLLSLSDFMISEGQYEDLFPVLNRIILNDSISRESKTALFSKVISDSGLIRSHLNDIELLLIVLEADNKDDFIIMLLRPEFYVNTNNSAQAIGRLEDVIKNQPENYYAWERLLFLYSEVRNWEKLFKAGEECATKFNRSFLAKVLYASAAIEKGELNIAQEELRKAKILAGSDSDKLVQVLVMDADVLYRQKEFSKSFEFFREALKINPDDAMILNNYAYYLAEQGSELKEAERMSRLVVEKEKGNTTYLDTYAWVLYKRGRFREAQKIMERIIISGEPPDAEWYEHLGYISKALKKCDKAIEYWQLAYKLDNRKSTLLNEIKDCLSR